MKCAPLFLLAVVSIMLQVAAQGPPPPPPPLGPPPAPPQNPVTTAKANLGKALFWDEQLSATRTVACGTCHIPASGGSDPRSVFGSIHATHPGVDGVFGNADDIVGSPGVPQNTAEGFYEFTQSFGLRKQVTNRRALPSLNIGYSPTLFWDGRAGGAFNDPVSGAQLIPQGGSTESQAAAPPTNAVEMAHIDSDWNAVAARVAESKPLALSPEIPQALEDWVAGRAYAELFEEAYGSAGITPARIIMALATYERTQFTNQAPIDFDTQHTPTLTQQEQQGRQIFGQVQCAGCHAGNRLTDDQFHYTGVRPVDDDLGRFVASGNNGDRGAMKTPGLRNVELHPPYMHNGRFATLEEVVEFYNRGGDFDAPNKDDRVRPRNLTQQQKDALVAFLKRPLTDPRVPVESPPFDRPTLFTESDRVPRIEGTGTQGSGGRIPQPIALEPPIAGNPRFTLAVDNCLGGASATLVIDDADPGTSGTAPSNPRLAAESIVLEGVGEGNGYGSVTLSLPASASLIGVPLYGRWLVADPAAPGGVAASAVVRFSLFGDGVAVEEGEVTEGEVSEGEVVEGEPVEGEVGEGEGEPQHTHSADPNHDGQITLTELLRVIQIFNLGALHCANETEDGFAAGQGEQDCAPHSCDYAPQDWKLSLTELLRLIQFYGAGGYADCVGGEDGYCIKAE